MSVERSSIFEYTHSNTTDYPNTGVPHQLLVAAEGFGANVPSDHGTAGRKRELKKVAGAKVAKADDKAAAKSKAAKQAKSKAAAAAKIKSAVDGAANHELEPKSIPKFVKGKPRMQLAGAANNGAGQQRSAADTFRASHSNVVGRVALSRLRGLPRHKPCAQHHVLVHLFTTVRGTWASGRMRCVRTGRDSSREL